MRNKIEGILMFFAEVVSEVSVLTGCDAESPVVSRRSKDLLDLGTLKMTPLNCLETSGENTQ
jgi:hypothetical protein